MTYFKLEEIWEHEWNTMEESLELIYDLENIVIITSEALSGGHTMALRGVSLVVEARFNRLTRVRNVEPFANEDE